MKAQTIWGWMFLAMGSAPTGAGAMDCYLSPDKSTFNSFDDLYSRLDGCTTIIAAEILLDGLRGFLDLPDIVNITGTITASGVRAPTERLRGINMPSLRFLGGLDFRACIYMDYFGFGQVEDVSGAVYIQSPESGARLEFGNLTRADSVTLKGTFSSVHFDSLETVDNDVIIESCDGCSPGNIDRPDPDDHLSVTLPSLVSMGYLKIAGLIGRISLPALKATDADIHINAEYPLDINLPLESADSIDLQGRITSVHLPNLSANTPLSLNSTYECDDSDSLTDVTCPIPQNLSNRERIGMGVGIAAGVACVGLGVWFLWRRRRQSREKLIEARREAGRRAGHDGVDGVDSTTELVGLESDGAGSGGLGLARPRTPPPAYAP